MIDDTNMIAPRVPNIQIDTSALAYTYTLIIPMK